MLTLALYRYHFVAFIEGRKRTEARRRCPYWDKRLEGFKGKINFTNGYGEKRPWFISEVEKVEKTPDMWILKMGKIKEKGNLDMLFRRNLD